MFAFMLESLVLRGVVRTGELGVTRLGFGVKAEPQVSTSVHSSRPDMRRPDPNPAVLDGNYPNQSIRSGAGRSRRHAGPSRREIATFAAAWWQKLGGTATAAAAQVRALCADLTASAGEGTTRLAILSVSPGGASEGCR
jgi:hypothetical protein